MNKVQQVEIRHINSTKVTTCLTDLPLEVNQLVVYETQAYGSTGKSPTGTLHVGVVIETESTMKELLSDTSDLYWVVDVIDTTSRDTREANRKEALMLKKKLQEKRRQFQEVELLKLIAKDDEETKQMLDRYIELTK